MGRGWVDSTDRAENSVNPDGVMEQVGVVARLRAESGLIAGVVTAVLFYTLGQDWLTDLSSLSWLGLMFVWLFGVIIWCAFGVVRHAEALADILGEPYGTLLLTISVVSIELAILAAIMIGETPNPTLPRETMFAVLMIVLNGMVGTVLVVGGLRHVQQHYNLEGATTFLAVLTPLAIVALVLPTFTLTTTDATFTPLQAILFALLTVLLYGAFLTIQTTRHRGFFTQPKSVPNETAPKKVSSPPTTSLRHRGGTRYAAPYHFILLLGTLLPVLLLSRPFAAVLDYELVELRLPIGLGGILIAMLILLPEWTAALRAASRNELQRAVNLSLGAALSTIGLTVPVVLLISVFTGSPLVLGLNSVDIVLLAVTLFLAHMTFSGAPTNILLGLVHVVLFFTFLVVVFTHAGG